MLRGLIEEYEPNVCLWHKPDNTRLSSNVRFWEQSGHQSRLPRCLLLTVVPCLCAPMEPCSEMWFPFP